jgi:hypothetical protein
MNGENFEHCVLTQLLPNLEELFLIVIDNASYQCPGETSDTELKKGPDNCLATREEDSHPRGFFQGSVTKSC